VYAQIYNAIDILIGVKTRLAYLSYKGLIREPKPLDVTTLNLTNATDYTTIAARKAFNNN
jgi:hypothetical protein